MTQVQGAGLQEGLQVIAGVQTAEAAPAAQNPLQPRVGGGQGRRGF
jgi:hypothetical protein